MVGVLCTRSKFFSSWSYHLMKKLKEAAVGARGIVTVSSAIATH
jgi:hypothetical protein